MNGRMLTAISICLVMAACSTATDEGGADETSSTVTSTPSESPSPAPSPTPSPTPTPTTFEMPDVVGMEPAAARDQALGDVQTVNQSIVPVENPDEDGTVVSQDPAAGTEIDSSTRVEIEVGSYEEPEPISAEEVAESLAFHFESEEERASLIDFLEEERIFDSVDNLDVDGSVLVIDATSGYATDEYIEDQAWEAVRGIDVIWTSDFWSDIGEPADDAWPGLRMNVDGLQWDCPGEAMHRLATSRISRDDWAAACGR